ncbi:hypothetical protein AAHD79_17620 [Citrobacter freundii]|uniref:hypothetical protein n=1 Tax=Citrobacter TaxID=544 RepID=UPI0025788CA3|nr:hypothetical protein [Citrobacter sp. Cf118]MDM3160266.1 hypothetical protein [Citrobacter sp. Cf118]MEB1070666.1 hypothetical protein [Citrobacter freundii]HBV2905995.1 hypothetical protein [Citrobacter freundii]
MTEHRCSLFLGRILSVATFCAFLYMIYVVLACCAPIRESYQLLVVQWCRNDDTSIHYAENISWHGLYVYLEKSAGNIILREVNTPIDNSFQPYRYIYNIIGHEHELRLASEKWGAIECQAGNKAIIGSSGYLFSWGPN